MSEPTLEPTDQETCSTYGAASTADDARVLTLFERAIADSRRDEVYRLTDRLHRVVTMSDDAFVCDVGITFTRDDAAWPMAQALIRPLRIDSDLVTEIRLRWRTPDLWYVLVSPDTDERAEDAADSYDIGVSRQQILDAFAGYEPSAPLASRATPPTAPKERVALVADGWFRGQGMATNLGSRETILRQLPLDRVCATIVILRETGKAATMLWEVENPLTLERLEGETTSIALAGKAANEALTKLGIEHDGLLPMQRKIREQ
ncbi:MAG: hypothetical protein ACHREM_00160 [Polyangiales bacterium]